MKGSILLLILFVIPATWAKDVLVAGLFTIVPYAYESNNQVIGVTPDIIKELDKESGIDITTKLLPYKRMVESLRTGEIDFAIFFSI
jgi:ABC-type amino acid transport substrate-binding protein